METTTLDNFLTAIFCPCYVCSCKKEFFACQSCANNGDVVVITQHNETQDIACTKGFLSGQTLKRIQDLNEMVKQSSDLLQREKKSSQQIQKLNEMRRDIDQLRMKHAVYAKIKSTYKEEITINTNERTRLEFRIDNLRKRVKRMKDKRARIVLYTKSRKKRLEEILHVIKRQEDFLFDHRRRHLNELMSDVFPITELNYDLTALQQSGTDDVDSGVSPLEEALADARGLQFVHGRWFNDQSEGDEKLRMSITNDESLLPGDGVYKLCEEWIKTVKVKLQQNSQLSDVTQSSGSVSMLHQSTGASMHSALCFSLQLLMVVKRLLDIHLPYNQHYKLLYDVNSSDFKSSVKRLNYNVMALCVFSKVDISGMHPLYTLHNVKSAMDGILVTDKSLSVEEGKHSIELLTSIESTLNDGSEPPSDGEEVAFENSPDFDEIDWDKVRRSEDVPKWLGTQDVSEIRSQQSHEPFQSVTDEGAHGLVSSAVSWMTRGWWNK